MMPATIARAASAGEAFSAVSASPILVSIGPGYTPNTCVFCPRSIARVTCVSEWVAAFDALYAARIGKLTKEATELRLAMAPPPLFASTGAKACVTAKVPRKFTSISCRPPSIHFGSVKSLDKVTLEKSLRVLKSGGQLISISGPPDAAFARSIGASWILRTIMCVLSYRIRAKAKRRQTTYSFLFMRASGRQLTEIASLIDRGIIRPVVDRVFPFASTKEAMAYVEAGRAKGKVVVSLSPSGKNT